MSDFAARILRRLSARGPISRRTLRSSFNSGLRAEFDRVWPGLVPELESRLHKVPTGNFSELWHVRGGLWPEDLDAHLKGEPDWRAQARAGWSPDHGLTHPLPPGQRVKGTTTLYDDQGNLRLQWIKAGEDSQPSPEAILEAFGAAVEGQGWVGAAADTDGPVALGGGQELLSVYLLGDPHVGLYAWREDAGEDTDLRTAERHLIAAIRKLAAIAPAGSHGLIINAGDFFHSDSQANATARGNNRLDVDTRWAKVMRTGIRTMIAAIHAALERHATVAVINEIGNHDDHSAVMLALCLDAYFSSVDRVTVDCSPQPFHYYRHGSVLLATHHGHTVKPDKLPGVLAADRPLDWGQTKFRHWYCGHFHSKRVWEYPGCTVEYLRTLAARDAWAHGAGYRSLRAMELDVWHRDDGLRCKHVVGVDEVA